MATDTDSCSFSDSLDSGDDSVLSPACNETLSTGESFNEETKLLKTTEDFEKTLVPGRNITDVCRQIKATVCPEGKDGDDDYLEYVPYMKNGLNDDPIDVLIICTETDSGGAEDLKDFIVNNVKTISYTIELFNCSLVHSQTIEQLCQRSVLLLLYVTEEFCNCKETLFKSQLCLIENLIKQESINVVPVYTCAQTKGNLVFTLKYLNPVRYYLPDKDVKTLKRILTGKKTAILKRNMKLEDDRKAYFQENKSLLKLLLSKDKENLKLPTVEQMVHSENEVCDKAESTELKSNILNEVSYGSNEVNIQCDTPLKSGARNKECPDGQKEHLRPTDSQSDKKSNKTPVTKIYNININNVNNMVIGKASHGNNDDLSGEESEDLSGEESDDSEEKNINKDFAEPAFGAKEK